MSNKLKAVFDCVNAEEELKNSTRKYIQNEIQKRNGAYSRVFVNKFAGILAVVFTIAFLGSFSYDLYFTASAYVDLDVNPSIELIINRFDRVIDTNAYNADGEDILSEVSLKFKSYRDALQILIGAVEQNGFLKDDGLVSVTLQANNINRKDELLSNIHAEIAAIMTERQSASQIDVFPVSSYTRSHAHELNISPAKYLAVLELIEADPTTTFETCKDHSIGEIKQLTKAHTENHHGEKHDAHHN